MHIKIEAAYLDTKALFDCSLVVLGIEFLHPISVFQCLFQNKSNLPSLTSSLNRLNDEEKEREPLEVEALAKKFENKYVSNYLSLLTDAPINPPQIEISQIFLD